MSEMQDERDEATDDEWRVDPFADVRMGKSLFEMRPEDWLVRVERENPSKDHSHDG